ncbi:RecX family transcriptional regulator [Paenibacillus sp. SYP-B4298]|uniref:RecX family transcriptional regulator n=1 Tax=Paenibacillus sp. SYP-B4298 TaxID=2996034 RepID=UPI0022DD2B1E|nr:RecX family transcriptional regulator [Paenibacillus sp. SYP-B4298]
MRQDGEGEQPLYLIVSVRRDKQRKGRYLLYTAGREEPLLSVHEDILVQYKLLKGVEVTQAELEDIIRTDSRQTAYAMAIAYLGVKPRTRKEIERYLKRKELDAELIEQVADRLEQERIIDDREYARMYASQRLRNHAKGRLAIRQELQQRGVSKQAAEQATSELDEETELAAALRAAERKWPYIKGEYRDRKRKLTMFLMRKGYPSDVVRLALKTAAVEADESELCDEDGVTLDN